jgi:hypothetical protein
MVLAAVSIVVIVFIDGLLELFVQLVHEAAQKLLGILHNTQQQ